jgi:hypothetical protein
LSPILQKFSALLLENVLVVLGNFVEGVGTFPTPIIVGGLLAFETSALLVVVMVQTSYYSF